jgi:hypothetical protein
LKAFECAWMQLNMIERDWTWLNVIECDWMWLNVIKCNWTKLNAIECTWTPLSESEHDWMHFTTDSYMQLSAHECFWVSVNAIEYAWVHVNTFERVLNAECNWRCLTTHECLCVRIEPTWMRTSSWGNLRKKLYGWFKLNAGMMIGANKPSLDVKIQDTSGSISI